MVIKFICQGAKVLTTVTKSLQETGQLEIMLQFKLLGKQYLRKNAELAYSRELFYTVINGIKKNYDTSKTIDFFGKRYRAKIFFYHILDTPDERLGLANAVFEDFFFQLDEKNTSFKFLYTTRIIDSKSLFQIENTVFF